MITLYTKMNGNEIERGLEKFAAEIKESIILSGVAAMAKVIYDEVKLNTAPPRMGRVSGNMHDAVYRVYSTSRSSPAVKVYHVGVNHSKAPHWHLLEYGTSRMRARPFIRPAFDHVQRAITVGNRRMKDRLMRGGGL